MFVFCFFLLFMFFFFFQAEDGIRDVAVTGVQTCALPISRSTPCPAYAPGSPSRSSCASALPVDAPDGTEARPAIPPASSTSASTVGRPRESRIWRARTPRIWVFICKRTGFAQPPRRLPRFWRRLTLQSLQRDSALRDATCVVAWEIAYEFCTGRSPAPVNECRQGSRA